MLQRSRAFSFPEASKTLTKPHIHPQQLNWSIRTSHYILTSPSDNEQSPVLAAAAHKTSARYAKDITRRKKESCQAQSRVQTFRDVPDCNGMKYNTMELFWSSNVTISNIWNSLQSKPHSHLYLQTSCTTKLQHYHDRKAIAAVLVNLGICAGISRFHYELKLSHELRASKW